MTNAGTFKKLIEKKILTGADVGRLCIRDLAARYLDFSKNGGEGRGLLTDAEKQTLVNRLSREEFAIYLKYREVHEDLKHLAICFGTAQNIFTIDALQLDNRILGAYYGERERLTQRVLHPTVVTQKQFEEVWQKFLDDRFSNPCSYETVFFLTYSYLRDQYNAGKKTPLDAIFKKWKKLPQEFVELMNGIEDQRSEKFQQKGRTPKDFFDHLYRYYDSVFVNDQTFHELITDLPELFEIVSDYMIKALPELKKVPKSKYVTNKKAASWKKLYEMDYCNAKQYLDEGFDPAEVLPPEYKGGIAILQKTETWFPEKYIDKDGNYTAPLPLFEANRAEHLYTDEEETVKKLCRELKMYGRCMFSYHELADRIGKTLKEQHIGMLLPPTLDTERILMGLNQNKELLLKTIQPYTGRNVPKVKAKINDLIDTFDTEELKKEGFAIVDKLPPLTVELLADNLYSYSNSLLRGEEL